MGTHYTGSEGSKIMASVHGLPSGRMGLGVNGCVVLMICYFCALSQRLSLLGDSLKTTTVCSSEVDKGNCLGLGYGWGHVKLHKTPDWGTVFVRLCCMFRSQWSFESLNVSSAVACRKQNC